MTPTSKAGKSFIRLDTVSNRKLLRTLHNLSKLIEYQVLNLSLSVHKSGAMLIQAALFPLLAYLPCYLSFSTFGNQISPMRFSTASIARSMSSGIPDFSQEPVEPQRLQSNQKILNPDFDERKSVAPEPVRRLAEPSFDDMKQMAYILANITEHLDTKPELAMTAISQNMGWLYSRNVPKLTQMLLQEFPTFRQDEGMMRAYMFVIEFLETVATETASMQKLNQKSLRTLLEAAKISEEKVDAAIFENKEQLLKQEFLIYLDAEIESQEANSSIENMLVTVKLRLLDEIGRDMGVDVMILPKLAAEEDPAELRRKTIDHLKSYDLAGKELFLQALRLMRAEMTKRYTSVDPILVMNLKEVEKIAESLIKNQ